MLMKYVATFAISTPKDVLNYATKLQTIYNRFTGKPYFFTLSFGFSCEACSRNQTGATCTHIFKQQAKQKDKKNEIMAEDILVALGNTGTETELKGVAGVTDDYPFKLNLNNLFELPRIATIPDTVQFIYSYVDGEGGSERSWFTIGSGIHHSGKYINLGMDYYRNEKKGYDVTHKKALLVAHYLKLLDNLPFVDKYNTKLGIAFESQGDSNMSKVYKEHLVAEFRKVGHSHQLFFYRLNPKYPETVGVYIDNDIKKRATDTFTDLIGQDQVQYLNSDYFVTNVKGGYIDIMYQLKEQLGRWASTPLVVQNPQIQDSKKRRYGGKQGGLPDDLSIVQLCWIHMARISNHFAYFKEYRLLNNIIRF